MSTSNDLIANQAKAVIALLSPDDQEVVDAYIADISGDREKRRLWVAGTTSAFSVTGVVFVLAAVFGGFVYAVSEDTSRKRGRCEGWCAHDTMGYEYDSLADRDMCTCVKAQDTTRIWTAHDSSSVENR